MSVSAVETCWTPSGLKTNRASMSRHSTTDINPRSEGTEYGGTSTPTAPSGKNPRRRRDVIVFSSVLLVWIAVDYLSKRFFDGAQHVPGDIIAGPFLGLFRFRLVHNTGAAWGMFGDSTTALAILSLLVCVVLVIYLFAFAPRPNLGQVIGLALVVAGGIGNIIDRLAQGYVIDFIEPVFIDFPVFNVADIGVTCGFVLFAISLILSWRREDRSADSSGRTAAEGKLKR